MRSRAELDLHQTRLLRETCAALLATNAFYGPRLRAAGIDPATVTPAEFVARLPFTLRDEWTRDQLDHPPFGTNLTYPLARYSRFCRTSGSTGQPMTWLDTQEDWGAMLDCWTRIFAAAGLADRPHRICFAFSFGPFLGFWSAFDAAARLGHLCMPAGGLTTLARLHMLMDARADVLCCSPTYAIRMAHTAAAEGIDLTKSAVRVIIVAGEPGGSIPATRRHLSELWNGARVCDHHGMTEIGPVSYECPVREGVLHVMEDAYLSEIVADELVLTTLRRPGAPLLRYRTGDLVNPERGGPCACGSHELRLLGGILGRKDDMVVVRGVNIFPSAVEEIVRAVGGVEEFQVRVARPGDMLELMVRIEAPGGESIRRKLEKRFLEMLFLRIPVEVVPVGTLPRFELKSKRWVREAAAGQTATPHTSGDRHA